MRLFLHFLIRTYTKQSVDQLDRIVAALAQHKNVWNPLIRLRFVLFLPNKIHFRNAIFYIIVHSFTLKLCPSTITLCKRPSVPNITFNVEQKSIYHTRTIKLVQNMNRRSRPILCDG